MLPNVTDTIWPPHVFLHYLHYFAETTTAAVPRESDETIKRHNIFQINALHVELVLRKQQNTWHEIIFVSLYKDSILISSN